MIFNRSSALFLLLGSLALAGCGGGGGGSDGNAVPVPDSQAGGGNGGSGGSGGGPVATNCPSAMVAQAQVDLLQGPVARGVPGDLVIRNNRLKAVIQQPGRNWYNISQFGGNIIDAALLDANGNQQAGDQFEEFALGTNVESSPNYQTVEILSAGGSDGNGGCNPAIIRATGPDDLLDFVNGSSAIRDMGFMFPASADDRDLPVTIQTDYILRADQRYITIETRLINDGDQAENIYLVEYGNGSGELEVFQYGYGFGEPLVTAPCDSCRMLIYAGHEGGAGVSYGLIHEFANSTSLSVSGVSIPVYATDATLLFATGAVTSPPPFTVPASGELIVTRYFAVGDGSVASIMDVKHEIFGEAIGRIEGQITDANGPVAGAEIAVIASARDFPAGRGPDLIVANHFRSDAQGRYAGTLRPGDYELRLNVANRSAGMPATTSVSIAAGDTLTRDFTAPLPARLRVQVIDENALPVPAKVQLIGTEASPDAGEPLNSESVLGGLLTVQTGVYGDAEADPLPTGIVLAEFAVDDPLLSGSVTVGDTGILEIEPGEYQLSVSHGLRYSEHVETVTLTAGQLTQITARVVRVVETDNHVFGDFHVHSFDSPDSEVTNRERVATYLAEGIEFFTPSDHGMRVDFEPVIADMNVGAWVASAPSSEITTFDYGHFNAWPTRIDNSPANSEETSQSGAARISQGSTDWGGEAPPGQDFPSLGHYSLSPAHIHADAESEPFLPNGDVVTQINHVEGHFGVGLGIDTGMTPPTSTVDPASRRLDPNIDNFFHPDFDSLEVWIGVDGREGQFENFLGQNLGDYFNLLNQGIVSTLVANSDTHERRLTSLSTRNIISLPPGLRNGTIADLEGIRSNPHGVGDQVIAGRSTASNALFMTVKARNAAGQTAGLEVDDTFGVLAQPLPLATAGEAVDLTLQIRSATWAEYDEILVYVNGETQRKLDEDTGLLPAEPARYEVCEPTRRLTLGTDFTRERVTVASLGDVDYDRFSTDVTISLPSPGVDYWIQVIARGTDGMDGASRPLWPVVPNSYSNNDGDLRNRSLMDEGTMAMAASNPIFIDADGDGSWTPPGVQTHSGILGDTCPGGSPLSLPTLPDSPL